MNTLLSHHSNANQSLGICPASCQKIVSQIQSTKNALRAEFGQNLDVQSRMLELALNEAEALATETEFPLLTFPALAREKAEAVVAWQARQRALWRTDWQRLAA